MNGARGRCRTVQIPEQGKAPGVFHIVWSLSIARIPTIADWGGGLIAYLQSCSHLLSATAAPTMMLPKRSFFLPTIISFVQNDSSLMSTSSPWSQREEKNPPWYGPNPIPLVILLLILGHHKISILSLLGMDDCFTTTASRSGILGFGVRPATLNANDLAWAVFLC